MRWRILALLFFARVGLGLQFQSMVSVGDDLVVALGLTWSEVGWLIGLFMLPGFAFALPAGLLGRHVADRWLCALGLALLGSGGLVSGVADDPWTLAAGRTTAGAGFLFSTLYFAKMVADWFEGREMATAMSVLVMSWPLGIAAGQAGFEWLAAVQGWSAPFLVAAAYCGIASAAIALLYRPATTTPTPTPPPTSRLASSPSTTGFTGRLSHGEWLRISCAGVAWALFNAGYVVYLTFAPPVLQTHGHGSIAAAAVVSVGSWIMVMSGAICGRLADRTGRRELIVTVCMIAAVAAALLFDTRGAGLGASLVFGLLGMAPAGVIMAMAGEAVRPERRAFAMGVFFTVYFALMTLIPPVAGGLAQAAGSPRAALALGAALFAAVVPVTLLFRWACPTRDGPHPDSPGIAAHAATGGGSR